MPHDASRAHPRHVGPVPQAPGATRRVVAAVTAVLVVTMPLAGCYSARPVQSTPTPGTTLLLDLSDRGRVALGPQIGASAERIQGVLQSVSDSGYTLRMSSVRFINGQQNQWTGEPFTVPTEFVSRTRAQRFSRGRTLALAVGLGAALVAVLLKTNLVGGAGGEHTDKEPGGSTGGT